MDTLVLDYSYLPICSVTWQRAITLLFEGKIEVIESYDNWSVHSVTIEIKVPAVIRWLKGNFRKKKHVNFSRDNIYIRDKARCQYCGIKVPRPEVTYDHVTPRSQGGTTQWTNIVLACVNCNQRKGGRTPQQAKMKLLTMPIRPKNLIPYRMRLTLGWNKEVPVAWRQWLSDQLLSNSYWNSELDSE